MTSLPAVRVLLAGLAVLGATTSASSQSWTQVSPASNAGNFRDGAAAFHGPTGQTVLFGGSPALNDTWLYSGSGWTLATPAASPPARRENAMAEDIARGRIVLFGGQGATGVLGDTWEWDGTTWTQASPAVSPPARLGHVMAYDVARQVTVLFGGTTDSNRPNELRDTWEWNGSTWTQVATATAPAEPYRSSMCFDIGRSRCVLAGGTSLFGAPDQRTWEYDGTNWTDVTGAVGSGPTSTPGLGVMGAGMVYDPARGVAVLHGGRTPNGTFSTETWEYDGTSWSVASTGTPSSRTGFAMAMDLARGVVVLYGGQTGNFQTWFQETWEYGGVAASYASVGVGCAGSAGVPLLAPAAGSLPQSGTTFTLELTNLPPGGGLCYFALGFSDVAWNGLPLPLALQGFGLPGCTLYQSLEDGAFVSHAGGTAQWALAIPTGFDGLAFFNQAVSFDAAAGNPAGAAVSNGGRGVVGN